MLAFVDTPTNNASNGLPNRVNYFFKITYSTAAFKVTCSSEFKDKFYDEANWRDWYMCGL